MNKRKQKKQAQKNAVSASQMGNQPNPPDTSVAEAIKKAEDKKEAAIEKVTAKVNNPPKPNPKPKKEKSQTKMIIGFGSKPRSKTIHAISSVDDSALCDIRTKNIPINDDLVISDVNCQSCRRYMLFKQLDSKIKPLEKTAEPKTNEPPKVQETTPTGEVNEPSEIEMLRQLIFQKMRKMEKRLTTKLEEFCRELIKGKPSFFIVRKGNNMFQIVHEESRYVITDNVSESDAESILIKFLELVPRWDGMTKPSKEWMGCVKRIHEEHFKKEHKPKRELKRRPTPSIKERKDAKPEKRVIRRRKK